MVEKSLQLEDSQPTTVIWPAEVSVTGAISLLSAVSLVIVLCIIEKVFVQGFVFIVVLKLWKDISQVGT